MSVRATVIRRVEVELELPPSADYIPRGVIRNNSKLTMTLKDATTLYYALKDALVEEALI